MECTQPYTVSVTNKYAKVENEVNHKVPCGKCLPCLSNKRRDWIFRLEQEHKYSHGALFVTLTYHPKYCPYEIKKRHLQLFIKRLRKHDTQNRVRYFAVGEYGTKRKRPHYHALLFNVDLSGTTVRKAWRFGEVHIGNVTPSSVAYCTKYIVQPEQKTPDKQPPFTLMSRAYGIGGRYLSDAMVDWHRNNSANYTIVNGVKNRLPRFYKTKIWYRQKDKEKISKLSQQQAQQQRDNETKFFKEKFGIKAEARRAEMRLAAIQLIKSKVAYTERL